MLRRHGGEQAAVVRGHDPADVLTGGEPVGGKGYYYPPTIITNVKPEDVLQGDSIEITLNASIALFSERQISVTFDGEQGSIVGLGLDVLKVEVPSSVRPQNTVWIVVEGPGFRTPPYRIAVRSAPMSLRILWIFSKQPIYVKFVIAFICFSIAAFIWLRVRKRALQKQRIRRATLGDESKITSSEPAPHDAENDLEPLQVPDDLITYCERGECVVFVGTDLARSAGLPTWREFVRSLLEWATSNNIVNQQLGISYADALRAGQADLVADGIASAIRASSPDNLSQDFLMKYLVDVFGKQSIQPTPVHNLIKQMGFSCALTTSLDPLLERALGTPVFVPQDSQRLLPLLAERKPFVLKLFGTLNRPETVQISPAQYRDVITDNKLILEFIEKLFLSRTVLFVGVPLDAIKFNMEALGLRNLPRSHYALVGVSGTDWRAKAESLRRFNIEALPYSENEGDSAVMSFLRVLETKVMNERSTISVPLKPPRLRRVPT